MPIVRLRLLALGCALFLAACHRDLSTGNVLVSVSPASASLRSLATQQFTAAVAGSDDQAVTWTVREGASGGTVTAAGLYTAPLVAGTFHVVATAAADPTQSATAAVAVSLPPPAIRAPAIRYSPDALACTAGAACGLAAPQNTGDAIASFAISPALPAGLALDATGAIVGTPTIVSAAASYQVTATNAGGSGSASITVSVAAPPLQPPAFAYAGDLACFQGIPCNLPAPASTGGPIASFAIAPALPAGLALDASTGAIVGTPTILSAKAAYAVTGMNASGSAAASVNVSVAVPPPAGLVYTPAALVCPVYASCLASLSSTGGPADGYAISPALPDGLSFDAATGAITGAATLAGPPATFTVTATNASGSATVALPITIAPLATSTISMSYGHTCILLDGGVSCWGVDPYGELGNNTTGNPDGSNRYLTPVPVLGLEAGVTSIGGGDYYSCAIQGGAVKCWGRNASATLGDNSLVDRAVPVQVVGLESGAEAISLAPTHGCALVHGGGVKCWGDNSSGQLGDNSTAQGLVAAQVAGLTSGVQALATGDTSSCALTSAGSVLCWGGNASGGLGNNSTAGSLVPVAVPGLANVSQIGVGASHACALVAGAVSCWGGNGSGQLGLNSTTDSWVPVAIPGVSGVDSLHVGGDDTCLLSGGGARCTGANNFGSLGDHDGAISSPVLTQVFGLESGVLALFTGEHDSCAFTSSTIFCWGGAGYSRQIGDGLSTEGSTPVALLNLTPAGLF